MLPADGTLVSAGITIVLDLVQPLDELLMMVSVTRPRCSGRDGEASAAAGNAIGGLAATAGSMGERAKDVAARRCGEGRGPRHGRRRRPRTRRLGRFDPAARPPAARDGEAVGLGVYLSGGR